MDKETGLTKALHFKLDCTKKIDQRRSCEKRYECHRTTKDGSTRCRLGCKNLLTPANGEDLLPGGGRRRILTLKQKVGDVAVITGKALMDYDKRRITQNRHQISSMLRVANAALVVLKIITFLNHLKCEVVIVIQQTNHIPLNRVTFEKSCFYQKLFVTLSSVGVLPQKSKEQE